MTADTGAFEALLDGPGGRGAARDGVARAAFDAPRAEWARLREHGGFFPLVDVEGLVLEGAQAAACLQGQLSNDVQRLRPGEGQAAAHLDRKGRMLAFPTVLCEAGERFRLLATAGEIATLEGRLRAPALLADLVLRREEARVRLIVAGPRAGQLIAEALGSAAPFAPFAHHATPGAARSATAWPLLGIPAWLVDVAPGEAKAFLAALREAELAPAGGDAHAMLRVEAGVPRWGAELGEGVLPPEANLEHAIDYRKGCYVGQETIARIRTYGRLRRRLGVVSAPTGIPEDLELFGADGAVQGRTCTSTFSPALGRFAALAFLRTESQAPGATLSRAAGTEADLRVEPLPLVAPEMAPSLPGQVSGATARVAPSRIRKDEDDR